MKLYIQLFPKHHQAFHVKERTSLEDCFEWANKIILGGQVAHGVKGRALVLIPSPQPDSFDWSI